MLGSFRVEDVLDKAESQAIHRGVCPRDRSTYGDVKCAIAIHALNGAGKSTTANFLLAYKSVGKDAFKETNGVIENQTQAPKIQACDTRQLAEVQDLVKAGKEFQPADYHEMYLDGYYLQIEGSVGHSSQRPTLIVSGAPSASLVGINPSLLLASLHSAELALQHYQAAKANGTAPDLCLDNKVVMALRCLGILEKSKLPLLSERELQKVASPQLPVNFLEGLVGCEVTWDCTRESLEASLEEVRRVVTRETTYKVVEGHAYGNPYYALIDHARVSLPINLPEGVEGIVDMRGVESCGMSTIPSSLDSQIYSGVLWVVNEAREHGVAPLKEYLKVTGILKRMVQDFVDAWNKGGEEEYKRIPPQPPMVFALLNDKAFARDLENLKLAHKRNLPAKVSNCQSLLQNVVESGRASVSHALCLMLSQEFLRLQVDVDDPLLAAQCVVDRQFVVREVFLNAALGHYNDGAGAGWMPIEESGLPELDAWMEAVGKAGLNWKEEQKNAVLDKGVWDIRHYDMEVVNAIRSLVCLHGVGATVQSSLEDMVKKLQAVCEQIMAGLVVEHCQALGARVKQGAQAQATGLVQRDGPARFMREVLAVISNGLVTEQTDVPEDGFDDISSMPLPLHQQITECLDKYANEPDWLADGLLHCLGAPNATPLSYCLWPSIFYEPEPLFDVHPHIRNWQEGLLTAVLEECELQVPNPFPDPGPINPNASADQLQAHKERRQPHFDFATCLHTLLGGLARTIQTSMHGVFKRKEQHDLKSSIMNELLAVLQVDIQRQMKGVEGGPLERLQALQRAAYGPSSLTSRLLSHLTTMAHNTTMEQTDSFLTSLQLDLPKWLQNINAKQDSSWVWSRATTLTYMLADILQVMLQQFLILHHNPPQHHLGSESQLAYTAMDTILRKHDYAVLQDQNVSFDRLCEVVREAVIEPDVMSDLWWKLAKLLSTKKGKGVPKVLKMEDGTECDLGCLGSLSLLPEWVMETVVDDLGLKDIVVEGLEVSGVERAMINFAAATCVWGLGTGCFPGSSLFEKFVGVPEDEVEKTQDERRQEEMRDVARKFYWPAFPARQLLYDCVKEAGRMLGGVAPTERHEYVMEIAARYNAKNRPRSWAKRPPSKPETIRPGETCVFQWYRVRVDGSWAPSSGRVVEKKRTSAGWEFAVHWDIDKDKEAELTLQDIREIWVPNPIMEGEKEIDRQYMTGRMVDFGLQLLEDDVKEVKGKKEVKGRPAEVDAEPAKPDRPATDTEILSEKYDMEMVEWGLNNKYWRVETRRRAKGERHAKDKYWFYTGFTSVPALKPLSLTANAAMRAPPVVRELVFRSLSTVQCYVKHGLARVVEWRGFVALEDGRLCCRTPGHKGGGVLKEVGSVWDVEDEADDGGGAKFATRKRLGKEQAATTPSTAAKKTRA